MALLQTRCRKRTPHGRAEAGRRPSLGHGRAEGGRRPAEGRIYGWSWESHKKSYEPSFYLNRLLEAKVMNLTFVKSGVRLMTVRFQGGKRPRMTPYDPRMTRI